MTTGRLSLALVCGLVAVAGGCSDETTRELDVTLDAAEDVVPTDVAEEITDSVDAADADAELVDVSPDVADADAVEGDTADDAADDAADGDALDGDTLDGDVMGVDVFDADDAADAIDPGDVGDTSDGTDGDATDGEVSEPAVAACPVRTVASYGGAGHQFLPRLAATDDGGLLLLSTFDETLALGGDVTEPLVSAAESRDLFLARLDADGVPQWAHAFGAGGFEQALAVATGPDGAIAVAANGSEDFTFGAGGAEGTHRIGRLDAAGDVVWEAPVEVLGATDGLAFTEGGDLVAVGSFSGSGTVGGEPMEADGFDAFVSGWAAADGAPVFARQITGAGQQYARAVAVAPNGDLLVGGRFSHEIVLGDDTFTTDGDLDGFVARLDPAGEPIWARQVGGADSDVVTDLVASPDGSVLVAADAVGDILIGDTEVSAGEAGDALLVRLDGDGDVVWTWAPGGAGRTWGGSVAMAADGGLRYAAAFDGEVQIGEQEAFAPQEMDVPDVVVVELSPEGVPSCARVAASPGEDHPGDVVVDDCDRTAVALQHVGDLTSGEIVAPGGGADGDADAGLLVLEGGACP